MLVVHDELDFAPGIARLKQGGGIAGHNGLKDISQRLASHEYWRLRIGVGKPPAGTEGADYVLQKPPAEERPAIDAAIDKCARGAAADAGRRHAGRDAEAALSERTEAGRRRKSRPRRKFRSRNRRRSRSRRNPAGC